MIPQVNIIITHRCNLFCTHCYMNAKYNNIENDNDIYDKAVKIIDKLCDMNISKIMITGGECTTSKNLIPILKYIKNKKIEISIFTNGLLFNDEIMKYADNYCLSVDGSKSYHNKLRGNDKSYENVIKTIKKLVNCNKNVTVQMTISKDNFNDLEENAKKIYSLGVRKLNLACLLHKGRALNNKLNSDIDFDLLNQKISDVYESTGYNLIIHTNIYNQKDREYYLKENGINFPVWIDLIDDKYYIVDESFGIDLKKLSISGIEKIKDRIKQEIIKIENKKNIIIEDEIINEVDKNDRS